ncbi:hypothetical protein So717_33890 [Roseobacter cerasinus]|uniref:Uncharacterized protein n=1 Tax=Roseobacter cerasinus TaxID=2602289 RepID=A0A640VZK3_9RHOB|nr:hypothetical protein [Roseobacter cerasinus]GFE51636.1 hypothetical protein So717_33890 [Roseobacter cerasinus]
MKLALFIVSGALLIGPCLAWTYVIVLGCSYRVHNTACGIGVRDYLDADFLTLAAFPWGLGLVFLIGAFGTK